jgi:hypothetical protein
LKLFFNELSLNPDAVKHSEKIRSNLTLHRPLDRSFIRKGDYEGGIFFEYNKKNTTVALMTDTKTNRHLDYEITVEYNYE